MFPYRILSELSINVTVTLLQWGQFVEHKIIFKRIGFVAGVNAIISGKIQFSAN